jgi:hypothetical protein
MTDKERPEGDIAMRAHMDKDGKLDITSFDLVAVSDHRRMEMPVAKPIVKIEPDKHTEEMQKQGYSWPLKVHLDEQPSIKSFFDSWTKHLNPEMSVKEYYSQLPTVAQEPCETAEEAVQLWWANLSKENPTQPEQAKPGTFILPLKDGKSILIDLLTMRMDDSEMNQGTDPVTMEITFSGQYGIEKKEEEK